MRFERIDPKTIKCFLSNDEMRDYEITYKDFLIRSEKAKEVLEQIIIRAEESVGYQTPNSAFDLQIIMMPERGMILTFSEKDPMELKMDELVSGCIRELMRIFEEKMGGYGKVHSFGAQNEKLSTLDTPSMEEPSSVESSEMELEEETVHSAIFEFESMRVLYDFVNNLPEELHIKSMLYRMNEKRYLWMESLTEYGEDFREACFHAMEFSKPYWVLEPAHIHMQEHGECILQEQVLEQLRRKVPIPGTE
ncbi:MAG: adaptor protein MecA [Lachnospiraceae bacterium]|jgi:negative regulator of genetic competence, sporulation and motility|nr:adaptor protein MecA [Lachnospiraceae bacterium]